MVFNIFLGRFSIEVVHKFEVMESDDAQKNHPTFFGWITPSRSDNYKMCMNFLKTVRLWMYVIQL